MNPNNNNNNHDVPVVIGLKDIVVKDEVDSLILIEDSDDTEKSLHLAAKIDSPPRVQIQELHPPMETPARLKGHPNENFAEMLGASPIFLTPREQTEPDEGKE